MNKNMSKGKQFATTNITILVHKNFKKNEYKNF